MTTQPQDKPFWIKPPWNVLFDLIRLHKIRPWDVDLSMLINSFGKEMRKRGYVDFSASGMALLSSSILLRLQSEQILKLEEPPKLPEPKPQEFIPPPLQLPFRYELTSTNIDSLVEALEEALRSGLDNILPQRTSQLQVPPALPIQMDDFQIQIEERMHNFHKMLLSMFKGQAIAFSLICKGKSRLEIVRFFMMLLYLAVQNKIELTQEDEFNELYIIPTSNGESTRPIVTV